MIVRIMVIINEIEEVNMIIWEIKVKMMIIEVKEVKETIRVKMIVIMRKFDVRV